VSEYDPSRVIDRLLRQDEAGLKMYLVCRLGGAQSLPDVYDALRLALVRGSSPDLQDAPSLKSMAYATARRLAHGAARASDRGFDSVGWMPTPERASSHYGEALDRIRLNLDPMTAELLELRYARSLDPTEIGYVVGRDTSDVVRRIEAGAAAVQQLVQDLTDVDAAVEPLIEDAFHAQTTTDGVDDAPVHVQVLRLAQGTLVGGRFEIESSLQTDSATTNYLANDTSMPGQSVVLHVLHRPTTIVSARTGLIRKLRLVDSVIHPSIERTLDSGWHLDHLWYATPWYRGHTLRQLVERGGLSPTEAVEIFAPIARGLAALHERGAVHRDVSLDRILLIEVGAEDAEETVPLLRGFDAWLADGPSGSDQAQQVAPETAKRLLETGTPGAAAAGEDVFLLALAVLESLAPGSVEAQAASPEAFLKARSTNEVPLPRTKQLAPFAGVLSRALSVTPSERQSAFELAEELEQLRSRAATTRRKRSLAGPIGALAVVAALFAFVYFVRASRIQLIRESNEAVEVKGVERELEAEQQRSEMLEAELGALRQPRQPEQAEQPERAE
jgi:hypothetical protein